MTNSKYFPIALWLLLIGAAVVLVDINWAWIVITIDSAILLAAMASEERTRCIVDKKRKPEILKYESPINWLKGASLFSIISLLSGFTLAFFLTSDSELYYPIV